MTTLFMLAAGWIVGQAWLARQYDAEEDAYWADIYRKEDEAVEAAEAARWRDKRVPGEVRTWIGAPKVSVIS